MWYVTKKSSPKPAEATVECREDEQGEEACERDGRDDLLQRGLLGSRAGLTYAKINVSKPWAFHE